MRRHCDFKEAEFILAMKMMSYRLEKENSEIVLLRLDYLKNASVDAENEMKQKARNQHQLPTKVCTICNREFTWRKKWEKNWETVKYCSKKCSSNK